MRTRPRQASPRQAKAMDFAMDRFLTATAVCVLAMSGPVLAQTRTSGNIANQLNQQEAVRLSAETAAPQAGPQGYAPQAYPGGAGYAAGPQPAPQGYGPQSYPSD